MRSLILVMLLSACASAPKPKIESVDSKCLSLYTEVKNRILSNAQNWCAFAGCKKATISVDRSFSCYTEENLIAIKIRFTIEEGDGSVFEFEYEFHLENDTIKYKQNRYKAYKKGVPI